MVQRGKREWYRNKFQGGIENIYFEERDGSSGRHDFRKMKDDAYPHEAVMKVQPQESSSYSSISSNKFINLGFN